MVQETFRMVGVLVVTGRSWPLLVAIAVCHFERLLEASMVIPLVNLVGLCDHEIVELILLVDVEKAMVGDLLDSFEVKVSLNHGWLGDEEFEDDQEADDRVAKELESFVVEFTTCARGTQSFFDDVDLAHELGGH